MNLKRGIIASLVLGLLYFSILHPFKGECRIEKSSILHNYAFDGTIVQGNGGREYVTVAVCCRYAFNLKEQPATELIHTVRYGFLGLALNLGKLVN